MKRPLAAVALMLFACASGPPPKKAVPADGVREQPLTPAEVEAAVQAKVDQLRTCYGRERLNLSITEGLSDYVFVLRVPNDGTPPGVEMKEETVPGQVSLAECLAQVLRGIKFPRHTGKPLSIQIPIQG